MWIARDKNNDLFACNIKPIRKGEIFTVSLETWEEIDFENWLRLDPDEFPEVTWENSPVEIKGFALTKGLDLKNKI